MPKFSKREWPQKVVVGNVTVKVYRQRAPRSKTGFEYVVAWRTPSGRERRPYAAPGAALDEAALIAGQLNAGQTEAAGMDRKDRDELVYLRGLAAARGVPPAAAMEEWAKARDICAGSIIPAAEQWANKTASTFKRILAPKSVDEFIAYKMSRGKAAGVTYTPKLKPIKTYFRDRFLDDISTMEWSAYLGQWKNGVTQNDRRKRAVEMCTWARDVAHHMPAGIRTPIEFTELAHEEDTEIGIISPETLKIALHWMHEHHPEHLAALVVAAFCGVRSDEIHGKKHERDELGADCRRQLWEDIDLRQKHLNVSVAKRNTPSWRLVPLCDAAIAWLQLCKDRTGPICVPNAMEKVRWLLKNLAKVQLPPNCFRHSYITYQIAVTGNKPQVATWAGNSVKEIDKRYRRPVPPAVGKAWFGASPRH